MGQKLKLKWRVQFPAAVKAISPITVTKSGLLYVFGLDVQALLQSINPFFLPVPTVKNITFANSPYIPLADDQVLLIDTSGGHVVVAMPLASTRSLDLIIKDATGNAGTVGHDISVTFNGGQTADGQTPYPIDSPYLAVRFGVKAGGYFIK